MTDTKFYLNNNATPSLSTASLAHEVEDYNNNNNNNNNNVVDANVHVGILPDSVYDSALVWWRAAARRWIMRSLKEESALIGRIQRYRMPILDTYFLYTSSLGTHTFFLLLLPACYFFGYDRIGRALMALLGMGVYWSSFFKDLICSPRPYTPSVARLAMGTHHLEYGFPSTHSTNSISLTLYLHTLLYRFYTTGSLFPFFTAESDIATPGLSPITFHLLQLALAWYACTIVFGRIYCGMHSFTDCVAGSLLGAAIWLVHWFIEDWVDVWARSGGLEVPLTLSLLSLLLINYHPQPVDDCPCFEDAVACIAALLGTMLGMWHGWWSGLFHEDDGTGIGNGGTFKKMPTPQFSNPVTILVPSTRLTLGIASIFALRLVLKSTLHLLLPPLYRTLSKLISLPNRRFYTPATEYERVPLRRGWEHLGPSVVDLGELGVGSGTGEVVSATGRGMRDVEGGGELKNRIRYFGNNSANTENHHHHHHNGGYREKNDTTRTFPNGTTLVVGHEYEFDNDDNVDDDDAGSVADTEPDVSGGPFEKNSHMTIVETGRPLRKRYDAEVLTKIIVYVSIGLVSAEFAPVLFERAGL
ncbi:hypothetical protein Clacol_004828 [Clathrus columnatus]|uniref:Phosphatidic acid phosphatase type 2/haloperoxidase domain-containing protein n=1 Tax=Clathrus columnatus TaxID=1419009 RepID=A0AAV5AC53_9AGAM|nr:hypothetical protein Clacol_004828 [Clathrus columnatus]